MDPTIDARLKPSPGRRRALPWRVVAVGLLVPAALVAVRLLDLGSRLRDVQEWVGDFGPWGPALFITIYVVVTLAAGPGLPFTLIAPVLFGAPFAVAIMIAASSLSAAAAFLIARHLARTLFEQRLAGNQRFARLNRLLDEHAWIIIPFVRVVPLPFALNNYGFGLTSISFGRYLLWSEVGMVPMNVVLVLGADSILGAWAGRTSWLGVSVAALAAVFVAAVVLLGRRAWMGRRV